MLSAYPLVGAHGHILHRVAQKAFRRHLSLPLFARAIAASIGDGLGGKYWLAPYSFRWCFMLILHKSGGCIRNLTIVRGFNLVATNRIRRNPGSGACRIQIRPVSSRRNDGQLIALGLTRLIGLFSAVLWRNERFHSQPQFFML